MHLRLLSIIFFGLVIPLHSSSPTPLHQSHFTKYSLHENITTSPQEYLEVTKPLPFDHLTPGCTLPIISHNFSNTYGLPPFSVLYSPPCKCTWSHVTIEIRVSCKGEQYDRIAAVWLNGAELIRTSTAEPTEDGVFWKVRKDVTRYSPLLAQRNLTLSVMLENIVNDVFTGVYQVNVTFFYYDSKTVSPSLSLPSENHILSRKLKSVENPIKLNINYEKVSPDCFGKPADLIIPISATGDDGYWFRIQNESDIHSKEIRIPKNTHRALIEIYVSFHGSDEFWYSNPPDSYIEMNNLTTERGHGAYREVLLTIDGNLVGSVVPFPVIFTGGINPLFWEPVVSIGAFDLPSYDFGLTPFLGMLLDGKTHSFGLSVADSISFWLVDANLHLWLDDRSSEVQARVDYRAPRLTLQRQFIFEGLDGSFQVEAKRTSKISGWVNSTAGNFTTFISRKVKVKNSVKFYNNGTRKLVQQKVKEKSAVMILSSTGSMISRTKVKRTYPLKITTENLPGNIDDTYLMITKLDNAMTEKKTIGSFASTLMSSQQCSGWMVVRDHDVLSGGANTLLTYLNRDGLGCYSRIVGAGNGKILNDTASSRCASSF